MSKDHLEGLVLARRSAAVPSEPSNEATLEPISLPTNLPSKEPSHLGTKEDREEPRRRRPWDGQDEIVQANFDVPKRIKTKLHMLKTWDRIPNLKSFVTDTLEKAIDREIAKAEKEGY
jgi:hypothetical protein